MAGHRDGARLCGVNLLPMAAPRAVHTVEEFWRYTKVLPGPIGTPQTVYLQGPICHPSRGAEPPVTPRQVHYTGRPGFHRHRPLSPPRRDRSHAGLIKRYVTKTAKIKLRPMPINSR